METYNRKAVFKELNDKIHGKDAFIEVTEWANGDGFDVSIEGNLRINFQMTFSQFYELKKAVKQLDV